MRIKMPKFVRKIACKCVERAIEEETGIRTNIEIGIMTLDTKGSDYRLYMAESISINKRDLKRFIKENRKRS